VAPRPSLTTKYVKNQARLDEGITPRVHLRVRGLVEPTLSRSEIRSDPRLGALSILRFPQGTNFAVTPEEAEALKELTAPRLKQLDRRLEQGDRVQLRQDVERYPDAMVHQGMTGSVVTSEPDLLSVRLDEAIVGLEDWRNELRWDDDSFRHDLERIGTEAAPPVGSLIRVAAPGRRKRRLHRVEAVAPNHVVLLEMWRSKGRWVEAPAGPFEHSELGLYDVVMDDAPRADDPSSDLP
jgi:hypothetical protein